MPSSCSIHSHSQLQEHLVLLSTFPSATFSSRHRFIVVPTMKQSLTAAAVLCWATLTQHASARRLDWEGEPLSTPHSVFVTWESSLNTGKQIIFVADSKGSSLLTYACDSKVTLGGVPIQVKADETGNGQITVGEKHYAIDFEVEKSGGVVCQARWNDDVAVVECEVPWTAGGLDSVGTLSPNVTATCLDREADNDLAMVNVFTEEELVVFPPVEEEEEEQTDADRLLARQCYDQAPVIKKKGNGNPHKWRRHKQVTVREIPSLYFHVYNLPLRTTQLTNDGQCRIALNAGTVTVRWQLVKNGPSPTQLAFRSPVWERVNGAVLATRSRGRRVTLR